MSEFKVIGNNVTYKEAVELKIPEGWELAEYKDMEEIINSAEKCGVERKEFYFFKQFNKKSEYKFSVLWLGRLDGDSVIIGDSCNPYFNDGARGVIIKKSEMRFDDGFN